ncbi:MAG: GGDEF domain-containing protein [Gallionella sp.]|nr:GGDEF domain-containing protein [Gallionella sp.]
MHSDKPKHKGASPRELLHSIETLTRHRDGSLVRLSAMQSLLGLVGPQSIRLYDVLKKDAKHFVSLSAWNEADEVVLSDGILSEDLFEPVADQSVMGQSLAAGSDLSALENGMYTCCIPVLMNDEPLVLFEMRSREPFDIEALAVARGVVAVFRNYLALLEDSQRDTLTGLLNRKTFDTGFAVLLSSAIKSEHDAPDRVERRSPKDGSHWLAVIDIDHFKRVNDTFGHLYGDEVLILMANLMRGSFRQRDRLYRFGGEEFVVLMRDVDFTDANNKLDEFRRKIEQHIFPQVGNVTISIGYTAVTANSTPGMVLGEADEALYYVKAHGRNQVRCYGELLEQKLLTEKTLHTQVEFF